MLSENYKILYRNLSDLAARAGSDLDDAPALFKLAAEHKDTMDKLRQAGMSQDPGLLEQVEKTHNRINLAIVEIRRRRDELGLQLGMLEKKKTVSAVYARNQAL